MPTIKKLNELAKLANSYEIKPDHRYLIVWNDPNVELNDVEMAQIRKVLDDRGFTNVIVVRANVSIFELEKEP